MTLRATSGVSRGYFAVGIEAAKKAENMGGLWRNAHSFGAAYVFTVGHRYKGEAADTTKAWRHVPGFEFADPDAFLSHIPNGAEIVAVECGTGASTSLPEFVHPERAVYVLGAEDVGISADILTHADHLVEIPGRFCLNVAVAGAIVLYDRRTKAAQQPVERAA